MAREKAKSLKEDKKYKDTPRFKVIYGYEDDFKNGLRKSLIGFQKEFIKEMWNNKP